MRVNTLPTKIALSTRFALSLALVAVALSHPRPRVCVVCCRAYACVTPCVPYSLALRCYVRQFSPYHVAARVAPGYRRRRRRRRPAALLRRSGPSVPMAPRCLSRSPRPSAAARPAHAPPCQIRPMVARAARSRSRSAACWRRPAYALPPCGQVFPLWPRCCRGPSGVAACRRHVFVMLCVSLIRLCRYVRSC